jgi:uncharacterized protein with HEPN domain
MKSSLNVLDDILRECNFLIDASRGTKLEAFLVDEVKKRAFARSIEIIGEAVKNLPEDLVAQNPGIPWKRMASMRDRLIHAYFAVDYALVWDVATTKIPELLAGIGKIRGI